MQIALTQRDYRFWRPRREYRRSAVSPSVSPSQRPVHVKLEESSARLPLQFPGQSIARSLGLFECVLDVQEAAIETPVAFKNFEDGDGPL